MADRRITGLDARSLAMLGLLTLLLGAGLSRTSRGCYS
jgi:hypothetical protein